jgi:DNA-binding CsgD family transcriptional regulator/tetratricopeptide (TPR) repeat protein
LVGREIEQRRLMALLDRVQHSADALVLRGDPGIGKTTLLDWVAQAAVEGGVQVLRATGHAADQGTQYLMVRLLLGRFGDRLEPLEPILRDALTTVLRLHEGGASDTLVGLAVLELLGAVGDTRPVLLLADDVQWFDTASVEVLAFLARRLNSERVGLVAATRSRRADGPFDQLPDLELSGLDRREAAHLTERLGYQLDDAHFARTGGNPLALQVLSRGDSEGGAGDTLTARLRDGFSAELAQLPPDSRRALAFLAVAGRVPDEVCVKALDLLGLDERAINVAASRGVLTEAREFRHPLLLEAAHPDASETAAIHDALADAYEATDDDTAALHRLRGSKRLDAAELERARDRAARLAAAGDLDDAITVYRAVAERSDDGELACEALRRAGYAAARQRRLPLGLELLQAATERAPTASLRARVAHTRAWLQTWVGSNAAVEAARLHQAIREAVRAQRDGLPGEVGASETEWKSLLGLSAMGNALIGLAACDEMGTDVDGGVDELVLRVVTGDARVAPDVRALIERAVNGEVEATQAAADPTFATACELLSWEGAWTHMYRLTEIERVALEFDADSEVGPIAFRRVVALLHQGDALAAYGVALHASERTPEETSTMMAMAATASIVGAGEATERVRSTLAATRNLGSAWNEVDALRIAAVHALTTADVAGAHGFAIELHDLLQERGFLHPGFGSVRGDLAEVLALAGDTGRLSVVLDELERGPYVSDWSRGVAARARGVAGDQARFPTAIALLHESVWETARTRLAWARAAVGTATGREQARAAADMFQAMGARPWAALAHDLDVAGTGPERERANPVLDDLSERERTVALAVARGLGNKQVAAELLISRKTVEAHLVQVYRKLGVQTRTQLTALCHGGRVGTAEIR